MSILAIACNGQQEVNLVGNIFPGLMPSEGGYEIGEFNFPYQTHYYVQLSEKTELIDIEKGSIQMKLNSFIILVDDTTVSYVVDNADYHSTSYFYKDSIRIVRAGVSFIDIYTNEKVEESTLYICKEPEFSFTCLMVIENISRSTCNYSLYYSDSCELPSETILIQYGKIRFRKHRKYRSPEEEY